MKTNKKFILGLLALIFLSACARIPQEIEEYILVPTKPLAPEDVRNSIVRVIGGSIHATGFFVARNKVVTNVHVAADLNPILVQSVDYKKNWTVEGITAFDVKNDLVILKVARDGVPLLLGNSDTLQRGETVSAVGYPQGRYTVAEGTLRSVRDSDKWLQMQVKIAPGNSGSPIINSKGQVIGIASGTGDPYSYAIPSSALKALLHLSNPIESLGQWRKRGRIRAFVYSLQGLNKYNNDRFDEAIADFNKAIELNPEKIYAYYNRGLAKFRLGDLEAAQGNTEKAKALYTSGVEDSTQAIKLNPDDPYTYHNRAGGKSRLSQLETNTAKAQEYYQDAINDWTHTIKLNPEDINAYSHLGIVKVNFGESKADQGEIAGAQVLYTSAIENCTHAIHLNPRYPSPYITRGYAQFRLGKTKADQGNMPEAKALYQAAIQDCTQAVQLNPENADAYGNRGVAKAALGDAEGAIEDFDVAIRLNPESAEIYYDRARAKESLGQTEAAKVDFQKAKALDPNVDRDERK